MAYQLEGSLLEVCTCNILCPCWVGENPDGGTCDGVLAWHFERGTINGTDVSGRTFVILTHIPGNILEGNWRIVVYIDDGASDAEQQALLDVWTLNAETPRWRERLERALAFGADVVTSSTPRTLARPTGLPPVGLFLPPVGFAQTAPLAHDWGASRAEPDGQAGRD